MLFLFLGGGPPTKCMPEELVLVGPAASHLGTRAQNPYDNDGAYVGVPAATGAPAAAAVSVADILSPMVNGNALYDDGDDMPGAGLFCVICKQWLYMSSHFSAFLLSHLTSYLTTLLPTAAHLH